MISTIFTSRPSIGPFRWLFRSHRYFDKLSAAGCVILLTLPIDTPPSPRLQGYSAILFTPQSAILRTATRKISGRLAILGVINVKDLQGTYLAAYKFPFLRSKLFHSLEHHRSTKPS